ncbi:hypothetical protein D3875_14675 [Deinococcus cavernae]|uniref:MarR family transcriptional regulator n=1 Tax=Deinococcus cavernae TaxID=2320857 RepID=A0A418V903_9DEIO|nr:hypothetical protein [Deinococcus cavernae]RJF72601.1 hypothetical protein D3875_14675 [Deinococcus cavernae]
MTLVVDVFPQAKTILQSTHATDISCTWCRKITALCNGERTLGEVARLLCLPMPVVQKLTDKALRRGWLRPQLQAPEPLETSPEGFEID